MIFLWNILVVSFVNKCFRGIDSLCCLRLLRKRYFDKNVLGIMMKFIFNII